MGLLRNRKNSKHQGEIGLARAIAWFANNGFVPLIPLSDNQDYDLAVDDGNRLYKVQVRTTYHQKPSGVYQAHLRVMGGNRSGAGKVKYLDAGKIDYLYVLTDAGDEYVIPCHEINARASISLGEVYEKHRVS